MQDFLNKNNNPIEEYIGQKLNAYTFHDPKFDRGDLNVQFDNKIVEDIITNQDSEVRALGRTYTDTNVQQSGDRANVYKQIGYIDHVLQNRTWFLTTEKTIEIFGQDVLEKTFGFDTKNIIGAIKSRLPGTGTPVHIDQYNKMKSVNKKTGRWIVHLQDWNWGEFCQVENRIMLGWHAGDCYQVPAGVPHLAVNFGIKHRNFFVITGQLN